MHRAAVHGDLYFGPAVLWKQLLLRRTTLLRSAGPARHGATVHGAKRHGVDALRQQITQLDPDSAREAVERLKNALWKK